MPDVDAAVAHPNRESAEPILCTLAPTSCQAGRRAEARSGRASVAHPDGWQGRPAVHTCEALASESAPEAGGAVGYGAASNLVEGAGGGAQGVAGGPFRSSERCRLYFQTR